MSIFKYNGSTMVVMVEKNCFTISSDRRLGVQLQTVATDFQRVLKIHPKLYIGLSGLASDAQMLFQRLVFKHKLYQMQEERDMKPETFASLVSPLLYDKRFGPYFNQPIIVWFLLWQRLYLELRIPARCWITASATRSTSSRFNRVDIE